MISAYFVPVMMTVLNIVFELCVSYSCCICVCLKMMYGKMMVLLLVVVILFSLPNQCISCECIKHIIASPK